VDRVDFQSWGEPEPIFFGPWDKVDSAKLHRKQRKTVLGVARVESWLVGASEKLLDVLLM